MFMRSRSAFASAEPMTSMGARLPSFILGLGVVAERAPLVLIRSKEHTLCVSRFSASLDDPSRPRCVIRMGFAIYSALACCCGGKAVSNGVADASSGTDGSGGATADGSIDAPRVDAPNEAGGDARAAPCMISASNYDQSCMVDTDCAEVASGDYCSVSGGICPNCGGTAINVGALAQFNADVSKTPIGSGALGDVSCGCRFVNGPCCRHGVCQGEVEACSFPTDTLPACADAGGACMPFVPCIRSGPPDACAYSDESCCLN
jgi:hypothetical protein